MSFEKDLKSFIDEIKKKTKGVNIDVITSGSESLDCLGFSVQCPTCGEFIDLNLKVDVPDSIQDYLVGEDSYDAEEKLEKLLKDNGIKPFRNGIYILKSVLYLDDCTCSEEDFFEDEE